eukprot:14227483-Heterocapsa_arctica.AAC.1
MEGHAADDRFLRDEREPPDPIRRYARPRWMQGDAQRHEQPEYRSLHHSSCATWQFVLSACIATR